MRFKRGLIVCRRHECEDFCKGTFALNNPTAYGLCPRCRQRCYYEPESVWQSGPPGRITTRVELEFCFDCVSLTYRRKLVLQDDSVPYECRTLHVQNPILKSEKRASEVVEHYLGAVNHPDGLRSMGERTLDYDDPQFLDHMHRIFARLTADPLRATLPPELPRGDNA